MQKDYSGFLVALSILLIVATLFLGLGLHKIIKPAEITDQMTGFAYLMAGIISALFSVIFTLLYCRKPIEIVNKEILPAPRRNSDDEIAAPENIDCPNCGRHCIAGVNEMENGVCKCLQCKEQFAIPEENLKRYNDPKELPEFKQEVFGQKASKYDDLICNDCGYNYKKQLHKDTDPEWCFRYDKFKKACPDYYQR